MENTYFPSLLFSCINLLIVQVFFVFFNTLHSINNCYLNQLLFSQQMKLQQEISYFHFRSFINIISYYASEFTYFSSFQIELNISKNQKKINKKKQSGIIQLDFIKEKMSEDKSKVKTIISAKSDITDNVRFGKGIYFFKQTIYLFSFTY